MELGITAGQPWVREWPLTLCHVASIPIGFLGAAVKWLTQIWGAWGRSTWPEIRGLAYVGWSRLDPSLAGQFMGPPSPWPNLPSPIPILPSLAGTNLPVQVCELARGDQCTSLCWPPQLWSQHKCAVKRDCDTLRPAQRAFRIAL